MNILPSECQLLDFYLNQPGQDPDWVQFVYERLLRHPLNSKFLWNLHIEFCSSTREQIINLYIIQCYGREDPFIWIQINDLDFLLRRADEKENIDYNLNALSQILRSLCQDRHDEPFNSGLIQAGGDSFHQFWQEQHRAEIEMHRRSQESLFPSNRGTSTRTRRSNPAAYLRGGSVNPSEAEAANRFLRVPNT